MDNQQDSLLESLKQYETQVSVNIKTQIRLRSPSNYISVTPNNNNLVFDYPNIIAFAPVFNMEVVLF